LITVGGCDVACESAEGERAGAVEMSLKRFARISQLIEDDAVFAEMYRERLDSDF